MLERRHTKPLQIPSATRHTRHGLAQLGLKAVVQTFEIQKAYGMWGLIARGRHLLNDCAVQLQLIGVIADRACPKTFLLEDEPFVQPLSSLLRGNTEVQIGHLAIPLVDEMSEEQVQSPQFTPFLAGSDILDVRYLRRYKHQAPRHNLSFLTHQEQFDLLWEAGHQQLHLFHAVHRRYAMMSRQHIGEQHPIFLQRLPVLLGHAVDIQPVVNGLASTPLTQLTHLQRVLHTHYTARTARQQTSLSPVQSIQILLCRTRTIYIRYRLIHHTVCLQVIDIPTTNGLEHLKHLCLRGSSRQDESTVCQSLVRIDGALSFYPISGE